MTVHPATLRADPAELDAIARSIAAHADATRTRATRLSRGARDTAWHGAAAAAFAHCAETTAWALLAAAQHLDDAAADLHRHARAVEHGQLLGELVHDAVSLIA